MRRSLWQAAGEELSKHSLDRRLFLKVNGSGGVTPTMEQQDDCVTLISVDSVRQVVAVVLVPRQAVEKVARNGIPLAPGLHELRHADRLDVHRETLWISAELSAEKTVYDPVKHPPDAFCFLTKARLNEGDSIAICSGTPETSCGVIYKEAAWDMAQESPTPFKCPNCGFDPVRAAWVPPVKRANQSLEQLFQLVAQGSR